MKKNYSSNEIDINALQLYLREKLDNKFFYDFGEDAYGCKYRNCMVIFFREPDDTNLINLLIFGGKEEEVKKELEAVLLKGNNSLIL